MDVWGFLKTIMETWSESENFNYHFLKYKRGVSSLHFRDDNSSMRETCDGCMKQKDNK